MNHLGVTKTDKILEIGCGGAFGSFILSRYAKEVVSIDISEELIRFLNGKLKKTRKCYILCSRCNKGT